MLQVYNYKKIFPFSSVVLKIHYSFFFEKKTYETVFVFYILGREKKNYLPQMITIEAKEGISGRPHFLFHSKMVIQ